MKKRPLFKEAFQTDREKEWKGMPEYSHEDKMGCKSLVMHFETQDDVDAFSALLDQKIRHTTKSLWHPKIKIEHAVDKHYVNTSDKRINPRYPLFVVSKGRADSRLTSKALDRMKVPYRLVIEEQEYSQYKKVVNKSKLIILDKKYQDEYDTFDDLGDTKSKGPGAARNFAWDVAISEGYKWHWVMDDNILKFCRYNKNLLVQADDGTIFRCMEDFCKRYKNVAMAGPQYYMFINRKTQYPPFVQNTRIYSCNLIRNDVPFRWRGRYNEDTDLSIRMMKGDWCTIQFNAFIQDKMTTQKYKGGNTEEFYAHEGTRPKSQMLKDMHPEITEVTERFGRIHHYVYYDCFKKVKLKRKKKFKLLEEVTDNYGMELLKRDEVKVNKKRKKGKSNVKSK
jgi:hypothetical protein